MNNLQTTNYAAAFLRGLLYLFPLVLLLAVWEFTASMGYVRPLFLPRLGAVITQFFVLLDNGEVIQPLAVSLYRAFAGLAIAAVIGTVIGMMMARLRWANWFFDPLVSLGFPSPKIVFIPLFILYFGIDHTSKILLVVLTCVFPMIIAVQQGASSVNRMIIWSAESMATSERSLFYRVILPASMPAVFTGVRITMPVALITAFTCEMVAGGGGVGAALIYAQRFFETPTVFVYIVLMLIVGIALDKLFLYARRWLIPWQQDD
ncbi:ABC transporter permease [Pollutimonas thiosulfatoxidans]|uniref:ABC transmembrane type-1 domain-containing protein n=1 Tax=Pollutimonas thiosulfatoxidans TaxID=2028345 RepID=A0A410GEF3_9BURK|nr:ABC transporter permease [Pollutimonas thiosulfatoxidans]QAA94671.1 hypothetical protein CKA81_13100 [Pollutimonas thiosulfatoxidans]